MQDSKIILEGLEQIIYTYSETTPSNIKSSERNRLVANAALAISKLNYSIEEPEIELVSHCCSANVIAIGDNGHGVCENCKEDCTAVETE